MLGGETPGGSGCAAADVMNGDGTCLGAITAAARTAACRGAGDSARGGGATLMLFRRCTPPPAFPAARDEPAESTDVAPAPDTAAMDVWLRRDVALSYESHASTSVCATVVCACAPPSRAPELPGASRSYTPPVEIGCRRALHACAPELSLQSPTAAPTQIITPVHAEPR